MAEAENEQNEQKNEEKIEEVNPLEEKFDKYNKYEKTEEEVKEEKEEIERVFLTISIIGAIIGFIIPLIMWGLKKEEFSSYTKKYLTDVLNFELFILILSVILMFVPVLGYFLHILLFIFNLIVVIKAYPASQEEKPYSFPIKVKFVK